MWVRFCNAGSYDASYSVQWDGGETDRTRVVQESGPGPDMTASIDLSAYANVGSSCWARAYIVGGKNHDSESNFSFPITPPNPSLPVMGITSTGGAPDPGFSDWYWTD